jgi:hypothetical protein
VLEPTQPKGGARRNRYAACQLAGVEPVFTTYDGDDPAGAALAVNIAYRHLTKGQQAMIAARALRVLELLGRGDHPRTQQNPVAEVSDCH